MARKAREKSSTGVYAIVLRGNGGIFKSEKLREAFSAAAKKYLKRGLIGVVFSDSRADMLVRESAAGISMDMKPLITSFARTYNREMETDGKVFADRFRSVPVESRSDDRACRAYMKGGEIAPQYMIGEAPAVKPGKKETAKTEKKEVGKRPAARNAAPEKAVEKKPAAKKSAANKPAAKKSAAKKPAAKKTAPKPVKKPEPAGEKPAAKPKKKSDLPSWLL